MTFVEKALQEVYNSRHRDKKYNMAIESFTESKMLEPEPEKPILKPIYGPSNITESSESMHQYEQHLLDKYHIMWIASHPDVDASPPHTDDPTIV